MTQHFQIFTFILERECFPLAKCSYALKKKLNRISKDNKYPPLLSIKPV